MEQSGPPDTDSARPVRVEHLVIEVINHLLDPGPLGLDAALDQSLQRIGRALGVDRAFLYRIRPDGDSENTHEWAASGVAALKQHLPVLHTGGFATWRQAFRSGRPVIIPDRARLAPDLPERAFLERIGVTASLMLPLRQDDRLLGVLGFDCETPGGRAWDAGDEFVLRSVGGAVAAILIRQETAEAEVQAQNHLQAILQALPDLVIELDPAGRLVACHSDKLPWLLALVHAGIGHPMADILPAPLAEALADLMRTPLRRGATLRRRVGVHSLVAPHWYDVALVSMPPAPDGTATGFVAVIRDLQAAQAPSEMASFREAQFTAFFEMCPHPILLNDYDTGEVLDGNRAFKRMFGIDPQREKGQTVAGVLPEGAAWLAPYAIEKLRETGSYGPIEAELRAWDGRLFPAILRGFRSEDPTGRRLVWALIEDVTEVRAQEAALAAERAALKATEARLVAAIEALDDGFAIWDAQDRLVLWNRQYLSVFARIAGHIRVGALYDDLLRAAIAAGVFGAPGERDDEALRRRLDRHLTDPWDGEDALADGRLIKVRERATPARETVGVYEDMTARRQADRRLQQVVESGDVAVWDWDAEQGLSLINDRLHRMMGYRGRTASLPDLAALLHRQDVAAVKKVQRALFQRRTKDFDLVCRVRRADGTWASLMTRGHVLARSADGRPRRISGVTLDISARVEAEQRLSDLIDGVRIGTWEHNFATRASIMSDRSAEMLGYTAADLNPLTEARFRAILHPEDVDTLYGQEERAYAAGQWHLSREIRLRHREGHWVWVQTMSQVVDWDAAGRPTRSRGMNLDITAAKALESALARERDTLAQIMATSVSGIIAIDRAGKVVLANTAAETVLGRSIPPGADLIGLFDAIGVTDRYGLPIDDVDSLVNRALAGLPVPDEVRRIIRWPDGSPRTLSVRTARLNAEGSEAAVVFTLTDITDAVESENRLRAAMTAAEDASRAKSDFLAAMSHEIRTPLNGVLGMIEVMDRSPPGPDQAAMLQVIRDSGEHLLSVINDILDLAKVEAGHLVLDPAPLDLSEVLARVLAVHRIKARDKGVQLDADLAGGAAVHLRLGDEQRLIQILHNLVSNAVKFTDAGWVRVTLDASDPGRVAITVADSGIGMSPADIARAFDDFAQGQGGIARRYGGTGLGLPIVRRLARLMGGDVSLSGAEGQGLEVRVDLAMPVLPEGADRSGTDTAQALPPIAVLAAEDNATNRIILGSMLSSLGAAARIFGSGEELLAAWEPGCSDVVLLDIAMPGMDGVATLRALGQKAAAAGTPPPAVIAVTANAMTHQVREYLAQGFAAVVAKPLRMEDLAQALRHGDALQSGAAPASVPA
jgi:PAS domain S-box-containing protein